MSKLFSKDMIDYFYRNEIDTGKIKKLDLSCWDTSNVFDMSLMF